MSQAIQDRARQLRELLGVSTREADDFVALTVAGERLRRLLTLEDVQPEDAAMILREYEQALPNWPHPTADDLVLWMERALSELEAEAKKAVHRRDSELLEDAAWAVDEVIAVAVALARAGHVERAFVEAVAGMAADWALANAASLPSIWELADDLEIRLGPDPEFSHAYRWTEPLSAASRTQLALGARVGLRDPHVRARIIDAAYESIVRSSGARRSAWPTLDAVLARMDAELLELGGRKWSPSPARVVAHAASAPHAAGEVWVVAILQGGPAVLLTLRASFDPQRVSGGDPFDKAPQLAAAARDAVRAAFLATARLMPQGLPPAPLDAHTFELGLEDAEIDGLDGSSLGLSAALALFSAWTEQPLPRAIVPTGSVTAEGAVQGVASLRAKAEAVRQLGSSAGMLVSRTDAQSVEDLEVIGVGSLSDAITAVGLGVDLRAGYRPWLGDIADRVHRLETMSRRVQHQDLSDFADESVHRWSALADRMALALRSLDGVRLDSGSQELVERSRAFAALAYTHAGELWRGAELLKTASESSSFVRVLQRIVRVSGLIDELPRSEAELKVQAEQLATNFTQLAEHERAQLEGQVFGTLGRALLHRRLFGEALPLLERAVDAHGRHAPHELGRSRIYLAMAQRMAGAPERALETLLRAKRELDTVTAPYSRAYAASTIVFLEYEIARALLDTGRAADAVRAARHALMLAGRQGAPWPKPAILRTLVWSLRKAGESADVELAQLQSMLADSQVPVLVRIREEAARAHHLDGEVY